MGERASSDKNARCAPLWSRMKREGSGSRRKCGIVRLRPRIEVTKRRRRPAAHGRRYPRPHPRLLLLARFFLRSVSFRCFSSVSSSFFPPLLSLSLSLSLPTSRRKDSFTDISTALYQRPESAFASRTRRGYTLAPLARAEVRLLTRSLIHLLIHSPIRSLVQFILPIQQECRENPPRGEAAFVRARHISHLSPPFL